MDTAVRHSVCALDCPDTCSVLVHIKDGQAVRLQGDPAHPVTRGFLCAKVTRYLEREYSPDRLLYPQRRIGAKGEGRFARITWDEALDEIAGRLSDIAREFGPEAILPYSYAGTMGMLQGSSMDGRFFHRLGASRLDRTICASAGGAGLMQTLGVRYGTEPEQFRHAKLIIAWGANILGTNVHLHPFITEARRQGARFYTIDPVQNRTTKLADKHYGVYPGSDLALALGLLHVIFREGLEDRDYLERYTEGADSLRAKAAEYPPERVAALTGLPADEIVALAREYATTRPAVIRLNYGIQRSERGGAAVRAVAMLPAVVGAWRDVGGGLQLSTSGAFVFDMNALQRPDLQPNGPARLVNMSLLGQALTELNDPPVKALVVYNSNPAAIAPNSTAVYRGLRRPDLFTVVLEQMPTDTADHADILLPVTTFLEHTDLYRAYGHYYVQMARPALPAPGETRTNVDIFRELAKRLGFTDPCFDDSDDDMIRAALASGHPFLQDITLESLDQHKSQRLRVTDDVEAPFLPFAEGHFGTPSGHANLASDDLEYTPPVESRLGDEALRLRFPLELLSPKNDDSMNSTFGNRPDVDRQTAVLTMHPEDAAPRQISTGDAVRVFNGRGTCLFTAYVADAVRPGVLRAPSSRWAKSSPGRWNVNALTSERLTDMGGGPTFYSCLVQVERCAD